MQELNDKIFHPTNCPDAAVLLSYGKGELKEDVAWNIEKHITDCPLCSDALEGLLLVSGTEVLDEVSEQNNYSNNFDFKKHKNRELKIVLTASVMAIASLAILYFNKPANDKLSSPVEEITSTSLNKIAEKQKFVDTDQEKDELVKKPVITQNSITGNSVTIAVDSLTTARYYTVKSDSEQMLSANVNPVITEDSKEKNNLVLSISGLPVTYIHELKAIDYSSLYDELDRKKTGLLKSLDARYSNVKSMEAAKENQLSVDTLVYSEILNDALLYYHDEKYLNAQHSFEKILAVYPDDQNALFYCGASYYHLKKPTLAINKLEKILDHRQSPFSEEAKWYLALSYHKNNNDVLCRQWLEIIIAEKGFYELKAKEILKEIR